MNTIYYYKPLATVVESPPQAAFYQKDFFVWKGLALLRQANLNCLPIGRSIL
jgi:hypothetical protein